jgi:DNA polymerase III gamma/tau subunit
LKRQAALFTESDLVRFFHSLAETETKLRTATQPRYQLEIGIVKLMQLRGVETIGEILSRLAALESGQPLPAANKTPGPSGGSTPPVGGMSTKPAGTRSAGSSFSATATSPAFEESEPSRPQAIPTIPPAPTPSSPTLSADATPLDRIKAVLERQRKMLLVTVLESAQTTCIEASELYVEFSPESRHFRDTLSKPENIKIIREACFEVTGRETGVRIAVKDASDQNQPLTREDEERPRTTEPAHVCREQSDRSGDAAYVSWRNSRRATTQRKVIRSAV